MTTFLLFCVIFPIYFMSLSAIIKWDDCTDCSTTFPMVSSLLQTQMYNYYAKQKIKVAKFFRPDY